MPAVGRWLRERRLWPRRRAPRSSTFRRPAGGEREAAPGCLRCESPLDPVASPETISFWECPRCHRRFTQQESGALTERWGGALSLVLYGVIFDEYPQQRAASVASRLGHLDRDWLVAEIELELRSPSQSVREIHDLSASEEDLREFLGLVAAELHARPPAPAPEAG